MTTIIVIALLAAIAKLWHRLSSVATRLAALEQIVERLLDTGLPTLDIAAPIVVPRTEARAPLTAEPRPEPPTTPDATPAPAFVHVPRSEFPSPTPACPAIGFEEIFGRRLPIWAGGVTLAVAGFLIVKYSIDAGLLSPAVRVTFGFVFGVLLIAGAELALRQDERVGDPRVRQALAGAGIATLYASILVAANLYGLVGSVAAFVGMAIVTALAIGLALRFGAPSAILGLIGGLAAPAMLGSGPTDVPLLCVYLALAVGGLCALSRNRRWMWFGAAALLGGFGWGAALILGGTLDTAATLSIGLYVLLIGILFPALLLTGADRAIRLGGSLLGCAQMAALVAIGGFAPLHWALFGLISIAILWLSRREPGLADLGAPALAIALLLALAWPAPDRIVLTFVLTGIALIYGVVALWRVWRRDGRMADAGAIAAIAAGIPIVPLFHYGAADRDAAMAALALLGAMLAAGAASLGWRCSSGRDDARFAILATMAGALCLGAAAIGLPHWALPPVASLVAAAMLVLGVRAKDPRIVKSAWGFGGATLALLLAGNEATREWLRAAGFDRAVDPLRATLRWAIPAGAALVFARLASPSAIGQAFAVLLGYVAAAQIVPIDLLPVGGAVLLVALATTARRRGALFPAVATGATIVIAWTLLPLDRWLSAGGWALAGQPLMVSALPMLPATLARIALGGGALALALAIVAIGRSLPGRVRMLAIIVSGALGFVAAHVLWKHVFAINDAAAFTAHGMAERTLWEVGLVAFALVAWRVGSRRFATLLGGASLAHFLWFTIVLHDPLWSAQHVGAWLVPAYGCAFALLWLAGRTARAALPGRARGWLQMTLVLLFCASALRQLFHGESLVAGGVGQAEDIARSIVAIAIAIAFLWWGIVRGGRDWRLASLGLLVCAVAKVFLRDAAGLDGLLRIGSFGALGFSLIGVGWLYSRFLPDAASGRGAEPIG